MNKKHELFEILKEVKMGNKMAAEAYDEILLLFDEKPYIDIEDWLIKSGYKIGD